MLTRRSFHVATLSTAAILAIPGRNIRSEEDLARLDWPQWRGPTRDGQAAKAEWPKSLNDKNLRQSWRIELGPSYSGPIVSGDQVFTTETQDRKTEVVTAFHRETGKQLWQTDWPGAITVPFFARSNGSWIRSTPACDGERLYVAGIRDVLVCLEAKSGDVLWQNDFVKQLKSKLPSFGFVCSPLLAGDFVYVQAGGGLVKADKKTGEIVWRSLDDGGGMYGSAFSSPIVATFGGKRQLVVQTRSKLCGVDLESGDELWSEKITAFRGMNILTPTIVGDEVFTSAYGGRSQLFQIRRDGDDFSVEEKWNNKNQGYMSSPVIVDGHIYMHLRNQRATCIRWEDGETMWTSKPFGKYWSIVANGESLLALDERGDLLLLRASPDEFIETDRLRISDAPTWAHIAVAGDQIFVRELNALTAYQWTD